MGPARLLLRSGLLLLVGLCGACPPPAATRHATPPPLRGLWHRVKAGETLAAVARFYGVPLEDVAELNGLPGQEPLTPARLLFIPGGRPPARAAAPAATDGGASPKTGGTISQDFLWPVPGGRVVAGYGLRGKRPHEGIDIAAPAGTRVVAAADGVVIYSGSGVRGYGNLVLLRHAGAVVTVYAHNQRNLVREKEQVKQGQGIAEVGQTGNATGNHLHFEIRRGETPLDPARYVHP